MNDLPRLKICGIGSESALSCVLKILNRKVERVLIGLRVGRRYGEIPLDGAQRVIKRFIENIFTMSVKEEEYGQNGTHYNRSNHGQLDCPC